MGTMNTGIYTADGSRVEIVGRRNGFTYITFLDGRNEGTTTKVPPSWVTEDESPKVYPTREAYARELWASLSDDDKADTLWQNDVTEADDEFFAFWTDNIDARNNGTVTFTRVDGGYTVQDEAAGEGE